MSSFFPEIEKLLMRVTYLLAVLFVLKLADTQAEAGVDFKSQIAPLLTQKCLSCHNPEQKKGGLDLTTRQSLIDGGESGLTVTAGDPEQSLLVDYISGEKPQMPKTGEKLTPQEVTLIMEWVAQKLPWPEDVTLSPDDATWWSFLPLTAPDIPEVAAEYRSRVRNPIDAFILQRLQEQGLKPSPEADRRTLIRRLKYDLLGLPPAPAEVEQFVNDPDPQAYEKLIETYLDSPRYGERWARHWLDVVHYGDTHGYDKDKPRPNAWPYRDYVIRSFNTDKPYGEFIREQIAGDVIHPDDPEGIIATGFLAAGPWDFISHVEVPETKIDGQIARSLDRDDMVRTVMETFNSVTIGCARCHNHKFDPFLMEDYYHLQAVFSAIDRADRWYDPDPEVHQRREQLLARQAELKLTADTLQAKIHKQSGEELAAIEQQLKALVDQTSSGSAQPEYGYHSQISDKQDVTKWVQVDLGKPVPIDRVVIAGCFDNFNGIGAGFGFPVRFRIEGSVTEDFSTGVFVVADRTNEDVPNPGTKPLTFLANEQVARYVRVTADKLALRKDDYICALAELEVFDEGGNNLALGKTVTALDSIEAPVRWRKTNLVDGIYVGKKQSGDPEQQRKTLLEKKEQIAREALSGKDWALRNEVQAGLEEVSEQLGKLPAPSYVYAAATEFKPQGNFHPTHGTPREIRLLKRGNINTPGEIMPPGAIAEFDLGEKLFAAGNDLPEGERRRALAEWISHRDHPLTWRSIVNRVWLYHFGRGIVDTPNDFGRMGQSPTHPELLNWLAVRFRDEGQSIKDLHRLICSSSTYRQVSDDHPQLPDSPSREFSTRRVEQQSANAEIDSGNQYYWRFNRQRLDAEAIRDAVLLVSGELDLKMYGPGFQDFVIEKPQHSPHYEYDLYDPNDPASHRRSIYRFAVRSQQQPFMTTLDCADPSMQVPKRTQTITPLQALSLLNNKFMVAMSERFAARVEQDAGNLNDQVARAWSLALSRPPTEDEQQALVAYAEKNGLVNTCRLILNLNEFVFVD